jgi:hypothetical protein
MADFKAIERGLQGYLASEITITSLIETFDSKPAIFTYPAPPGATAPYICLFNIVTITDDTHSSRGERVLYQINVWSSRLSVAEDIISAIDNALHQQTFIVTGYTMLYAKRVRGPTLLPLEAGEELTGLSADYELTVQE